MIEPMRTLRGPVTQTRVLLVDDHQMFADTIVQRLELEDDLEVVATAADLDTACRAAALSNPDVVLLDLLASDGPPVENLRVLLAAAPTARVIVLTGRADPEILRSCVEAGCHGYLTKDRSSAELVDAVRAVAAGDVVIVPSVQRPTPVAPSKPAQLSKREFEVLGLLAEGHAAEGISKALGISRNTARAHIQRVLDKMGARSQLEAVSIGRRAGWI